MAKPLHQRLRDLIPQKVKDVVPKAVKDRLRPPAWKDRDTMPAPEWALGEHGELRYVWGDPAVIHPTHGTLVTVTEDSKGHDLEAPVQLVRGTVGVMVATGPDFVVMQFGEGPEAPRYRVPKAEVENTKPEHKRRIGEVELRDL